MASQMKVSSMAKFRNIQWNQMSISLGTKRWMTGGWGKVLPRTSLRHTESLLITENGFQKSKKQATDSGKGYQKDSCLGKHSLTRARMTDYMRQDLLHEEQTSRDGYPVRDTVSSLLIIIGKGSILSHFIAKLLPTSAAWAESRRLVLWLEVENQDCWEDIRQEAKTAGPKPAVNDHHRPSHSPT